jgi:hypothetical protein
LQHDYCLNPRHDWCQGVSQNAHAQSVLNCACQFDACVLGQLVIVVEG